MENQSDIPTKVQKKSKITLIIGLIVLFLIIGGAGYYLGRANKGEETQELPIRISTPSPTLSMLYTPPPDGSTNDPAVINFIQGLKSYTRTSPSYSYKCYRDKDLDSANLDSLLAIKKQVTSQKRVLEILCTNSSTNEVFVSTVDASTKLSRKTEIISKDNNHKEIMNYFNKTSDGIFYLFDWFSTDKIIFGLTPERGNHGKWVYIYLMDFSKYKENDRPLLIEACTSEGSISPDMSCLSFKESNKSQFVKQLEH